uniref:Uncharacterized protein MANES_01G037500 n=1 Tax=Rhizophora mucronata TaxID=61149 RepID=A0A2P2MHH3_RHIMU
MPIEYVPLPSQIQHNSHCSNKRRTKLLKVPGWVPSILCMPIASTGPDSLDLCVKMAALASLSLHSSASSPPFSSSLFTNLQSTALASSSRISQDHSFSFSSVRTNVALKRRFSFHAVSRGLKVLSASTKPAKSPGMCSDSAALPLMMEEIKFLSLPCLSPPFGLMRVVFLFYFRRVQLKKSGKSRERFFCRKRLGVWM